MRGDWIKFNLYDAKDVENDMSYLLTEAAFMELFLLSINSSFLKMKYTFLIGAYFQ